MAGRGVRGVHALLLSPTGWRDRIRIEIQRDSEPAIRFDVALSEVANLSSLARASARATGFSTFVRFNRLHRSPELWLAVAAAVTRAVRIAAIDRLRTALAAAWSRLTPARVTAGCRGAAYVVFLTSVGYITASPWAAM